MRARTALFAANRAFGIAVSRLPLLRALHEAHIETIAVCAADEHAESLRQAGCTVIDAPVVRGAWSPLADVRFSREVRRECRRAQPMLVHVLNAKPVILGAPQARNSCRALVATITGLGHAFIRGGPVRWMAGLGYRRALPLCDAVIFQNPADRELFLRERWVRETQAQVIPGSGVDLAVYEDVWQQKRVARSAPRTRVLMAARLLRQKGVLEYARAAELVRLRVPEAQFVLAGERDRAHPDSLTDQEIDQVQNSGAVSYVGWMPMDQLLANADLLVAPSYREGLSRVVLEAAACGVPAVVSDAPGVRDAVEPGATGLVVPAQDARALADAVCKALTQPQLLQDMGARARTRAVEVYGAERIVRQHLELYARLGVEL